jgi:threonine dehydrogenase-like Zn-dependent dehydrogenase
MDILLPKLEDWPFDMDMIISHELPLSAGARAYEIYDRKEENSMKILLNPGMSG